MANKNVTLKDVNNNSLFPKTSISNVFDENNVSLDHLISGLPLGMILSSAVVQNDGGLHLLDGSDLSTTGIYAQFCTWLIAKYNADNTSVPVVSGSTDAQKIANYEAELNTHNGQCGKFIIGSNFVRLPKITKFIEGLNSLSDIGKALNAGLPNITGTLGVIDTSDNFSGAFYKGSNATGNGSTGFTSRPKWEFNASLSNNIYGNSTTVQPDAIRYPYYIVVATIIKTQITVDLDQYISDLNLKLDNSVPHIISTYENGTSGYRIWSDGYCEQWGKTVATGTITTISLFKSYESLANYNVSATQYWEQTTEWNANFHIASKTVNSFNVRTSATGSNNTAYWSTKGKLAVGQY